ncbi:MAG: MBL fold metallo-hydrolase [Candidatus Cloacimonetes bacterium]|jgi:glyoxylase-like metal-dependent hydrolase (beta-lactamase superfamily II)|nr:MBL fold metallo-hydrolase [Candidatus Cloacimonadota bacterium]
MKIDKLNNNIILFKANVLKLVATVIDCGNFFIVIDTLLLKKDTKQISEFIYSAKKPIRYILNTHWHSDHYFGNTYLIENHKNNDLYLIANEYYQDTINCEKNLLNPKKKNQTTKEKFYSPNIIFNFSNTDKHKIYDFKLDFNEDVNIQIYYTPGHTIDSICIFDQEASILWTGDTILSAENGFYSIPYFYWGNPYSHLKSLFLIKELNPKIIISGHGELIKNDTFNYIEYQINYLQNLITSSEAYFLNFNKTLLSEFCEQLSFDVSFQTYKNKKLWIEKMHSLNLEKMYYILYNQKEKK